MSRQNKKIVVTRKLPDAVEARLRQHYDVRLNETDQLLAPQDLVQLAKGAEALLPTVTDRLDATFIDALPDGLKLIANFGVGYDHIDLKAAMRRGIVVTNTPGVLTDATAEIALLLLLGAARHAGEGHGLVSSGRWTGWTPTSLLGRQITGKTLGILGMGRIGRTLAKRARAFDMDIHYHNSRQLDAQLEDGAHYHSSAESLFRVSSFLSLNAATNEETRRIVDADRLKLLPRGAVIINTARGDLVDDDALIEALKSGHIAAAGLDVYAGEPNIHPGYLALDKVFLLPHLGSATVETRNAMGFKAIDNLDAYFAGTNPPDRIV